MNIYIVAGLSFLAGAASVLLLRSNGPENPQDQYNKNNLFNTHNNNQRVTTNADTSYLGSSWLSSSESGQYEVFLVAMGPDKISAIKAVREISNLSLKDAKELVESSLPARVARTNDKQQAYWVKQQLEKAKCVAGIKEGNFEIQ